MDKNSYFWTDLTQAQERLTHCVVLYDDQPFYIESVEAHEDGIPRARLLACNPTREASRKMLNSPKFKRFRDLPRLGWSNMGGAMGAALLERRAVTTRTHGLNNNNVSVKTFRTVDSGEVLLRGGNYNFNGCMFLQGFSDANSGKFPTLAGILQNIAEGSAIAYSRKFCVFRDTTGIRWLYRNSDRVGLFTGVDTLNLLTKFAFLREEIMEDEAFTLNTIREF